MKKKQVENKKIYEKPDPMSPKLIHQTRDEAEKGNDDLDEELSRIFRHPLVYATLESLVIDLRFKSFLKLELRNVFDQKGDLINSFADVKRDEKCIFLTDDKTLQLKGDGLFIFLT